MFQRKCHVCGKVLGENSTDNSKSICAECGKIAFAVSVAMLEINRRSRSRPDQIQVPEVIKIISGKNFMRGLWAITPSARRIVRDLANPLLRMDYLDEEKINRCFDFFEEAEELAIKNMGRSNYKRGQMLSYKFIKSFPNVKELVASLVRKVRQI